MVWAAAILPPGQNLQRQDSAIITFLKAVQPGAAARWARRRPTGCTPTPAPLGAAQVWVVGALGACNEAEEEAKKNKVQLSESEGFLEAAGRAELAAGRAEAAIGL